MEPIKDIPKKRWWQLKLRPKFILLISVILVVIFGLMAFFLIRSARTSLTNSLNSETEAFAALATKPIGDSYVTYQKSGTLLIQQQMQKFANLDASVSNIAVVDLSGMSQFSLSGRPITVSTESVGSFNPTTEVNQRGQITLAVQPYLNDSGQHSYSVVYQISPAQVEQAIQREELTILILMVLGLLISSLAAFEFINFAFLVPLNSLNESARKVASGDFNRQLQSQRYDEIGMLSRSIGNMANALKANISKLQAGDKQKDEFIKIVSHNLRTPLTIIQSNASFLENAQLDKSLEKMVKGIEDSARRLNLFSEQMLTITDFESNQAGQAMRQESTLNEMLAGLTREYADIATDKNISFKSQISSGDTKFFTSQYLIAQAVRNLLDNAFKFTSEGGVIELSADLTDKVVIKVSDTGVGIKPEELPQLFAKFHRGTGTMVYNYEGTGIGLYVTRLIIEQQGGKVYAASQVGKGSVFTIELPLVKATAGETIQ